MNTAPVPDEGKPARNPHPVRHHNGTRALWALAAATIGLLAVAATAAVVGAWVLAAEAVGLLETHALSTIAAVPLWLAVGVAVLPWTADQ